MLTGTGSAADFSNVGTSGFVFLQLPATARYAALGETGITLPDVHAEGVFINPALLARSDQAMSFNLSYATWYVETSHQAGAFSLKVPQFGTIGLQVLHFDFGEIQKTRNPYPTETGSYTDLGQYSAGGFAFGLSYARMLTNQFAFGATVKYVRESIDASFADNIIFDLGFLYETGLHSIRVGAFLQNFGLDAKYIDQKFKMPQQMKMGISAEVWGELTDPDHLTVLAEVVHPNDVQEHIQFGLEGVISHHLVFRAGYKFGYDAENLTLGMGLRFDFKGSPVRFDASYMNHEYLQSTMRFTLGMEF
ncbi:MAG: PorV/PorQ family protein [Calditrichales bacterium]|nr:MAG: PorV/PorQ family protein [Calditrichales bacterium]